MNKGRKKERKNEGLVSKAAWSLTKPCKALQGPYEASWSLIRPLVRPYEAVCGLTA